jgi:cellulose biosynthesis protein BcsQ
VRLFKTSKALEIAGQAHSSFAAECKAAGGTGVTLTAAELALEAKAEGKRVLAIDTCPLRHLKRDIEDAGFHYLDDVRQLFRPAKEARWKLDPMPRFALLCYPEAASHYLSLDSEGKARMGYAVTAGEEFSAEYNLYGALAFFILHYDLIIVDVANRDKRLMQLFHDACNEVHLMLREDMPGCRTVEDWLTYIERPKAGVVARKIITHADRKNVPGRSDPRGQAIALKPFLAAAQNGRSTAMAASQREVVL